MRLQNDQMFIHIPKIQNKIENSYNFLFCQLMKCENISYPHLPLSSKLKLSWKHRGKSLSMRKITNRVDDDAWTQPSALSQGSIEIEGVFTFQRETEKKNRRSFQFSFACFLMLMVVDHDLIFSVFLHPKIGRNWDWHFHFQKLICVLYVFGFYSGHF